MFNSYSPGWVKRSKPDGTKLSEAYIMWQF